LGAPNASINSTQDYVFQAQQLPAS
jgi:hypothetical protein